MKIIYVNEDHEDYELEVRAAIDYWNKNLRKYTDYNFTLKYVNDTFHANIIVRFEQVVNCDGDIGVWGCAELLSKYQEVSRTHARIKSDLPRDIAVNTIKHELGHLFGLEHGDEPTDVMSEDVEIINRNLPNASERQRPFGNEEIKVAIDWTNIPDSERDETRSQFRNAQSWFEKGGDGHLNQPLNFTQTNDYQAADVRISFPSESPCLDGDGSCGSYRGFDIDTDEEFEYYTDLNVTITGIDTEARGWHLGYWLAVIFTPSGEELPPIFQDASYDERRSEWWK